VLNVGLSFFRSLYIIALDDNLFEVRITKFRINFYFSQESTVLVQREKEIIPQSRLL
jgi:hypothetical protein